MMREGGLHPGPVRVERREVDVPDRMAPQTSGLCGTEAREAPQPRGEADPSPTICSRSDTHSGLLQAFFFRLRSQRHLLAPWPARAWALVPLSTPGAPILTASWVTPGADNPLRPGRCAPFPLRQAPRPGSAAAFLPVNRVRMHPSSQAPSLVRSPGLPYFSQPTDPSPGAENQHTRNNLGFQLWALHANHPPHPAPCSCRTRVHTSPPLQLSPPAQP